MEHVVSQKHHKTVAFRKTLKAIFEMCQAEYIKDVRLATPANMLLSFITKTRQYGFILKIAACDDHGWVQEGCHGTIILVRRVD